MDWFFVVARGVHFAASIGLFGVFAFECLIAGLAITPACMPPGMAGLGRRLDALAWVSLLLVVVSGAAWLLAVAATMSGQRLAAALTGGVWQTVWGRTRFGEDWQWRFALAVLSAFCLKLRRAAVAGAAAPLVRWAGLFSTGALLAALAWAGHGAATPGTAGDVHLAADIVHLLGAGGWLGLLLPFATLLIAARRAGDPASAAIARGAARRFSMLAIASVMLLLFGGLVNTWFLAGSVPALVGTFYGRLLLAKIGLFLATLTLAAVNLRRLSPRLGAATPLAVWQAALWLRRNALAEAGLGAAVLAIVGALGTLPPAAHSEPGWPLPFRLDLTALAPASRLALAALAAVACIAIVALVGAAAAGRYRRARLLAALPALCLAVAWAPLQRAIEPAFPTSFYAPAEPYAAPSIGAGAQLYAANCALCHGAGGRGDGPAAAALPVRPADLTAAHLLAHPPGDLFWWISNGRGNGAMPGFAAAITPRQRWDVVNFIRARAAGAVSRGIGASVTGGSAPAVPDFAFDRGDRQVTLRQALRQGPVLLALFDAPAPPAHVAMLIRSRHRFEIAALQVVAVDVAGPAAPVAGVVGVAPGVLPVLALFRAPGDGAETDLLLDRNGTIRARFAADKPGLPDAATVIAEARRAAAIPAAVPSHAGHAE